MTAKMYQMLQWQFITKVSSIYKKLNIIHIHILWVFVCGEERGRDLGNRERETKLPMVCITRQLLIFSLCSRGFSKRHKNSNLVSILLYFIELF